MTIENVRAGTGRHERDDDEKGTKPRVPLYVHSRLPEQTQGEVSHPLSPSELRGQNGDAEQEQNHAARAGNGSEKRGGDNQEHAEDERQDTTRAVRESFPSHLHALHMLPVYLTRDMSP